jgi:hypothetical protein
VCYEENGEGGFTSDLSTSVFDFFSSFFAFLSIAKHLPQIDNPVGLHRIGTGLQQGLKGRRAWLATATPFARFRSSRHCYFCYFRLV